MGPTERELKWSMYGRAYGMGDIKLGSILGHYPPQVPLLPLSAYRQLREALDAKPGT